MRGSARWTTIFMALAACRALEATAEDWPRWRGPNGDGAWQGPRLPEQWPADGLKAAWRQPVGGGYSGIAVADGRVYTMDRQTQPAETERVLCFEAATGKVLWQHSYPVAYGKLDYGTGPRATPTVHEGRLYTLGATGHCCCLTVESGDVVWEKDLIEPAKDDEKAAAGQPASKLPEWGLAASPVIWKNLVITHPGAKPGGCFVALDRVSGKEVWRAGDDPAGYATPILIDSPSVEQLVGWTPEHVLGMSPATGQIHWSVPYKVTYGVSIATPIFQQDIVLVSGYWEGSKAIRLGPTPRDATLLWEDERNVRGLMSQPLYREGLVYCLDKHHGLVCFELETGTKLWDDGNQMTPRGRNPQANLVWLGDEDRAIILNSEGELILARLNRSGYQEQSRAKIIEPTWAHPAFAGAMVFARNDTELVAVPLPAAD